MDLLWPAQRRRPDQITRATPRYFRAQARASGALPTALACGRVSVVWVFLPVLGGALAHAPVLKWDLLKPLKRPIDGGATFRGRRLFGDNKTWRGAIVVTAGVLVATLLLWQWPWWRDQLPDDLRDAGPLPYGFLLGLGVVLGELPNSFAKRQLDIPPGAQRRSPAGVMLTIWDQAD